MSNPDALTPSTWPRFYHHSGIPRLTSVLNLAVGLVGDLGLKNAPSDEKQDLLAHAMGHATIHNVIHTPNEKRAYLGCFMLASTYVAPASS